MAGKITRIWEAIAKCFQANDEPMTMVQIIAWIDVHFPSNDFNRSTLTQQVYRSCANVPCYQPYKAPKILYFYAKNKTYSKVRLGVEDIEQLPPDTIGNETLQEIGLREEDKSDLRVGFESQLRGYLAKNLTKLEEGLTFWKNTPPSIEYFIGGRYIDLLAKDKDGLPVVIELKKGRAYDRVVGQALLYQALVLKTFQVQKVRVILVGSEMTDELRTACMQQPDFKLFEYELTMRLTQVDSKISEEEEV